MGEGILLAGMLVNFGATAYSFLSGNIGPWTLITLFLFIGCGVGYSLERDKRPPKS